MKVLFLSQRVPYPPNRGDKITTWRLLERMARTHEVTVVAFAHDEADHEGARLLAEKGFEVHAVPLAMGRAKLRSVPLLLTQRPLTLGVFESPQMRDLVARLAPGLDAAYAEVTRHAPARRPATAAEVAATIGWLVSEQATGIHGATLTVDGGSHVVDAEGIAFLPPA